ncbi:N-acetylmuramoyl-L-alanine amidase [Pseudanabaena mucicola]|uniref:N-acetylmuramoyl-L-alanine amidase n=1 Tax=Pseudanabaena mucicola FACHB-723 TaxID=2692860 RepID=A0ABR7ZZA0_9CYAN|nr:N-acetylmuramoyl-L-alanine amidase [Pseudanabaena mucicola]MBD2188820.1 N-acetylmuramoyl-L-alanine amidase [Pseudanabaena mucicola FACHB-723]
MNQHYKRGLWLFLSLLAGTYGNTQTAEAQSSLRSQDIDNRQAQLPLSAMQQLQLRDIKVGTDGLALLINGLPQISTSRVANPDRIIVDLQSTVVPPWLNNSVLAMNRYGVKQIRVGQFQQSPAIARLVFDLDNNSPTSWQSSFDQSRGILAFRPTEQTVANKNSNRHSNRSLPTTIEGLSFNGYGQLVIQANQSITYSGRLDPTTNTYSFSIPAAQISQRLRRPVLGANSPIEQIRLNQVNDAVVISVKTITGWQIQETARTSPQTIALQLTSIRQVAPVSVSQRAQPQLQSQLQANSNSNGRQLVMIDPGHGGPDVGATRNGLYEKDITMAISRQLGGILQQMGYSVMYTRTSDIDLDLEPRVKMADNAKASAFVSIHVNSLDASSSQVNGVETYHAPNASLGKNLAESVHQQIIADTGANDRGVRSARFYVVTKTSMPAVLVETGFITNPTESAKLVNAAYQERMATAIAKGVDQFLKSYRR